ncbi:PREDICTED: WAT1-related protein At5g40210-like [Nelumbo nucifera]|uniref:WAT1-related protein At5g40210-like n=1 Tax=Nelumbo nucifera TaxID=4432 RepID=A0A1U7ZK43_NELNU|nr:PREDICTED: WAT1-related protein At5g40210-like [Nelumbo nucifera]
MRSGWWSAVPFAGMVVVEFITVILIMLCKAAMLRGMSNFIFIMYSSALCTLFLLPFFFFHRATLPPVTFSHLCKLFLLGLIGILVQIFSYTGLNYSSPMLNSAMSNVLPAFTFILAIIFSVIGSIIIALGFYAVIWGKAQEEELVDSGASAPLLQGNNKLEET